MESYYSNFSNNCFETIDITKVTGYTLNVSYPVNVNISDILSITHYDSYEFLSSSMFGTFFQCDTSCLISNYNDDDGNANGYFDRVKGVKACAQTR